MTGDVIHLANDRISVSISALGAELQTLRDAQGRDYLWDGDAQFWTGRAPLLFPIVGRAPQDRIAIGDHSAPMPQHGFARRARFTLIDSDGQSCTHELTPTPEIRAVYPFEFRLRVIHRLDENRLSVSAEVSNLDTQPLPFGLGFHPAFRWPLPGGEGQAHFVTLNNGAAPEMARLEDGLLPAERHPSPFDQGRLTLEHNLFDADAMIFPQGAGTGLTYGPDHGPRLEFQFETLPNLALWTKPGAPFVCIEPWHGMAALSDGGVDISERPFTRLLRPGGVELFTMMVTICLEP